MPNETYTPSQLETEVQNLAVNYRSAIHELEDISDAVDYCNEGTAEYQSKVEILEGEVAELQQALDDLKPVQDPALALMDWEGTILKEYTKEQVLALTGLPAPSSLSKYTDVDHEWLLFQEWNWSLADIKEEVNNPNGLWFNDKKVLCVGAIYTVTDGQEHKYWDDSRLEGIDSEVSVIKTNKISNAYYGNYKNLRAINIPYGETQIRGNKFYNCYSLISLNFPSSITSMGSTPFDMCNAIRSISLPKNCCISGGNINYQSCYSLERANQTIYFAKLSDNVNLTKVIIPNEITNITSSALYRCRNLKIVHLKKNVEQINNWAFENCSTLANVVLESKPILTNVGNFNGTSSYLKIYVPQSNLSWFETATNWSTFYANNQIVTIEDNIAYLESIGIDVDEYKEVG